MVVSGVKPKLAWVSGTFLLVIAAVTAICTAWTGLIPAHLVETWYSRWAFPMIASVLAPLSWGLPISWMDIVLPLALITVIWLLTRKKIQGVLVLLAAGYLFFFLSWGLNYQRMPLVSRLDFQPDRVTAETVAGLRLEAVSELNALYAARAGEVVDERAVLDDARRQVARIVEELDGIRFPTPAVKTSRILNPLFRASGVSGMFNPFGREALVTEPLLDVERPVVVMHEIAHVFGYANEGEASFIAFLAAIHSPEALARYSGWLSLWLYLRSPAGDALLDAGPREDIESIYARWRKDRVEWVSEAGDRTFDTFLRANRVRGGLRSYSDLIELAAGTRGSWERFAPRD